MIKYFEILQDFHIFLVKTTIIDKRSHDLRNTEALTKTFKGTAFSIMQGRMYTVCIVYLLNFKVNLSARVGITIIYRLKEKK